MGSTFENPMMYWFGMNFKSQDPADLAEFNAFYNDIHIGEVVKNNPGFLLGHRYELLAPDPRGDFGPQFLAMYEIGDAESGQAFIDRSGKGRNRDLFTPEPPVWMDNMEMMWSLVWRQIAESGPTIVPDSIYMVGIDAPEGIDEAGLAEFNDFYTNIHMHEAAANLGYSRAVRYELAQEQRHPEPHCPQFLAIYEGDEKRTRQTEESLAAPAASGPPPAATSGRQSSQGPEVWRQHTTPWRLTYRRIGP
jgi:hypothetical protein